MSSKLEDELSSAHSNKIVFPSVFMPHSREYEYTQEIKAKASDVAAVLSPTATDCEVQWERAVGLLIRELDVTVDT